MTDKTNSQAVEAAIPKLPPHPEPHSMTWSALELATIGDYGMRCFEAGRATLTLPQEVAAEVECKNCDQLVRALREATEAPTFMGEPVGRLSLASNWVWTHIKSGGEYELIGNANVQADASLKDLHEVYVYQGQDGRMWVRPVAEFNERFKRTRPLAASRSPAPAGVEAVVRGFDADDIESLRSFLATGLSLSCAISNGDIFESCIVRILEALLASTSTKPADEVPAIERYRAAMAGDDYGPLENLRAFCSMAMNGQDWIDVEQFFDALAEPTSGAAVKVEERAVFEEWLDRVRPSGDVTEVQRQWIASSDYADWLESTPPAVVKPAGEVLEPSGQQINTGRCDCKKPLHDYCTGKPNCRAVQSMIEATTHPASGVHQGQAVSGVPECGIKDGETFEQAAEGWAQWCEVRGNQMLANFLRRAATSGQSGRKPAVDTQKQETNVLVSQKGVDMKDKIISPPAGVPDVRVDGIGEGGLRLPLTVDGVAQLADGKLGVVVQLPKQIGEMRCWLHDCKTVESCAETGCEKQKRTTQPPPPASGQPSKPLIARSLAEWHEDDGPVSWWVWCGKPSGWAMEPAWMGTPNDSDWPGYHTHWTAHPAFPSSVQDSLKGTS